MVHFQGRSTQSLRRWRSGAGAETRGHSVLIRHAGSSRILNSEKGRSPSINLVQRLKKPKIMTMLATRPSAGASCPGNTSISILPALQLPSTVALDVARAWHGTWGMRYVLPEWMFAPSIYGAHVGRFMGLRKRKVTGIEITSDTPIPATPHSGQGFTPKPSIFS